MNQEPKKNDSSEQISPMTRLSDLSKTLERAGPPPKEVCWTCPECGPVTPRFLPTGRWIKRSCACQIREQQQRQQEEARQEWLREQALYTYGSLVESKHADTKIIQEMCSKTFDNYRSAYQPEGFEKALAFAEEPRGNLLLYGDYGVGKTHLEAAICNYIRHSASYLPEGQRMTSLFISAPRFFTAYEESKWTGDERHTSLLRRIMRTHLLILDDIDKSRPTESRWEIYWLIFDERYRAKRPTVLSTNKQEELEHYIGAASLSRLSRGLVVVPMVGSDYRGTEEA